MNRYEIDFGDPIFPPLFVDETCMKNAVIRAKYERLTRGQSTDVKGVKMADHRTFRWSVLPYLEVDPQDAAIQEHSRVTKQRQREVRV